MSVLQPARKDKLPQASTGLLPSRSRGAGANIFSPTEKQHDKVKQGIREPRRQGVADGACPAKSTKRRRRSTPCCLCAVLLKAVLRADCRLPSLARLTGSVCSPLPSRSDGRGRAEDAAAGGLRADRRGPCKSNPAPPRWPTLQGLLRPALGRPVRLASPPHPGCSRPVRQRVDRAAHALLGGIGWERYPRPRGGPCAGGDGRQSFLRGGAG